MLLSTGSAPNLPAIAGVDRSSTPLSFCCDQTPAAPVPEVPQVERARAYLPLRKLTDETAHNTLRILHDVSWPALVFVVLFERGASPAPEGLLQVPRFVWGRRVQLKPPCEAPRTVPGGNRSERSPS